MKKAVKILIFIWVAFTVLVIFANLFTGSVKLEMVQHGEMEKSYSFDAVIIRDETVINAQKSGYLESIVEDNEMVRKNKHVASIYEARVNNEVKTKLSNINSRINEIGKVKDQSINVVSASHMIEAAIDEKMAELTIAMEANDIEKAVSVKNEADLLSDRKNVLEKGHEYTDKILNELMAEKQKLESELGSTKQDLFSPASGIYSTNIDGYEEILSSDAIGKMTPDDFEAIKNMKITREDIKNKKYPCKIIDNFNWHVAFVAGEDEIAKLNAGTSVYLRNSVSSKDLQATVSYISAPSKGKYLVIVSSDSSCEWATRDRFVKIELVKNKYSGLKVPIRAIRVKDGEAGVYVVVDGIVRFKKTKVLYKDSGYAIVQENNASQGGLLLYDEVIVSSPKDFKVGDKIS